MCLHLTHTSMPWGDHRAAPRDPSSELSQDLGQDVQYLGLTYCECLGLMGKTKVNPPRHRENTLSHRVSGSWTRHQKPPYCVCYRTIFEAGPRTYSDYFIIQMKLRSSYTCERICICSNGVCIVHNKHDGPVSIDDTSRIGHILNLSDGDWLNVLFFNLYCFLQFYYGSYLQELRKQLL